MYHKTVIKPTYLITCSTADASKLTIMPTTIDLVILVEVNKVNQHFSACRTYETSRVPAFIFARAFGENSHLSAKKVFVASLTHLYEKMGNSV